MVAINLGTSVTPGADASYKDEVAGEAILVGQLVYRESSTLRVRLAVASSAEQAECLGVAMSSAPTAGQAVRVQWAGDVENCATLVLGEPYFVADTAGSVMPAADLATGDYVSLVGIAKATTTLKLGLTPGGVAHA